jgi:hypothetical protein
MQPRIDTDREPGLTSVSIRAHPWLRYQIGSAWPVALPSRHRLRITRAFAKSDAFTCALPLQPGTGRGSNYGSDRVRTARLALPLRPSGRKEWITSRAPLKAPMNEHRVGEHQSRQGFQLNRWPGPGHDPDERRATPISIGCMARQTGTAWLSKLPISPAATLFCPIGVEHAPRGLQRTRRRQDQTPGGVNPAQGNRFHPEGLVGWLTP